MFRSRGAATVSIFGNDGSGQSAIHEKNSFHSKKYFLTDLGSYFRFCTDTWDYQPLAATSRRQMDFNFSIAFLFLSDLMFQ